MKTRIFTLAFVGGVFAAVRYMLEWLGFHPTPVDYQGLNLAGLAMIVWLLDDILEELKTLQSEKKTKDEANPSRNAAASGTNH